MECGLTTRCGEPRTRLRIARVTRLRVVAERGRYVPEAVVCGWRRTHESDDIP
jgi:hypothetical protein